MGRYRWTYDGNGNVTSQVADNGASEVYSYSPTQSNAVTQATFQQSGMPPTDQYKNITAYYGYDGELQDLATSLLNLRARTYNPVTGQFLTRAPLEQQIGQAYLYAGGDPVNQGVPYSAYPLSTPSGAI